MAATGIPMMTRRGFTFLAAALCGSAVAGARPTAAAAPQSFRFAAIEGGQIDLAEFAGRPVLVVNTASRCGFTPQYDGLQDLWEKYRDQGLVVIAVPSNDFGSQELDSSEAIKEFCTVSFAIDFPMTERVSVKGKTAHPFYQWAAGEAGLVGRPRWNFHKFLIGPDGQLIDWFSSATSPQSDRIIKAIEAHLPNAASHALSAKG